MFIGAGSMIIYDFELVFDYFKSLPRVECGSVVNKLLNYCKNKVLEPFYDDKLSDSAVSHFWSYVSRISGVVFSVVEFDFLLDEVLFMDNLSIFLRDLEASLPADIGVHLTSLNDDLSKALNAV